MLCSLFVNVYRKYYCFLKDNLLRWEDQAMSFQNGVKTVIKMFSVDWQKFEISIIILHRFIFCGIKKIFKKYFILLCNILIVLVGNGKIKA